MISKRFTLGLFAIVSLALFFVLSGAESLIFFSDSVFVDTAEADDNDKDDDDKDDDKDDDMGSGDFIYDQDNWTVSGNCSNINKLQIRYHKDFISTEDASGPNVLVVGADGSGCSITIEKISGGNKCGFSARKRNGKLQIDTKTKNNAQNCEMCIKVVIPRNVKILG